MIWLLLVVIGRVSQFGYLFICWVNFFLTSSGSSPNFYMWFYYEKTKYLYVYRYLYVHTHMHR